jgi:SAM-dependent methyltransferase
MSLSTADWHQRYLQQAQWTQNMRTYLYQKASLEHASRILDIGCGTGVLEQELPNYTTSRSFALDIDRAYLSFAKQYASHTDYALGNALSLPYADRSFEVTFCHFLMLWVKDVHQAVAEMVRVTYPNGIVLALAEPDYGGRIDFPPELSQIGTWQATSLHQQGANPFMGRELRSVFHAAGLVDVEVGVMAGQWDDKTSDKDVSLEWKVIRSDLRHKSEFFNQADRLEALENTSRKNGKRVLFVPTFYAIGRVKG